MDICPPELHSYICQLACTDDGRTVRSLTRVSKYFREIASPYLYQSLAISGLDRTVHLASKLGNTPPHLRRIRHLFLSDQSQVKSKHDLENSPCDLGKDAIIRILTLAAPTLETLALFTSCPSSSTSLIARLFRIPFPHLLELTIVGYYPFPQSPRSMPRLERLHLSGNRNPHGLLQMGTLDETCPGLTHLRVSGLSMAVSFSNELEEALKGDEHVLPALFPSKLPRNTQCVLIQPGPALPVLGGCGTGRRKERVMMDRLVGLAAGPEVAKGVQFSVLERTVPGGSYEIVRRDWMDRLAGGQGCWVC